MFGQPSKPDVADREELAEKARKERIAAYWRDRDVNPDALGLRIESVGYHPSLRCATYGTRSNMKNGLPPGGI